MLIFFNFVYLAGEAGIEPTSMVLETTILTVVLLPYALYYITKK